MIHALVLSFMRPFIFSVKALKCERFSSEKCDHVLTKKAFAKLSNRQLITRVEIMAEIFPV